jgi:hypothetical protein
VGPETAFSENSARRLVSGVECSKWRSVSAGGTLLQYWLDAAVVKTKSTAGDPAFSPECQYGRRASRE